MTEPSMIERVAGSPRPVGSTFKLAFPPSNSLGSSFGNGSWTTAPSGMNFTIWNFRVKAHHGTMEVLDPVDEEGNPCHVAPVRWELYRGICFPVPPDWVLQFLEGDWGGPISVMVPVTEALKE